MSAIEKKVLEASLALNRLLPELAKQHLGKWVVFFDDAVQSVHETADQAYAWAIGKYGPDAGAVVAPVIPPDATPVSAGVMYGLA